MGIYTNEEIRKHLPTNMHTIIECGCCNGEDTIDLMNTYNPEQLFTFEANPDNIIICKENLANRPKIKLIEKAVSDQNGFADFYPGDPQNCKFPNGGISSLFPFNKGYEQFAHKKAIRVATIRLDSFMLLNNSINKCDLLCLDIQGAELKALIGLGEKIYNVGAIILEFWLKAYYRDIPLLSDVKDYLEQRGLKEFWRHTWDDYGDIMFKR